MLNTEGYEVSTVVQQIEAVRGSLKSLEKKLLYAKMQQTSDAELCKCLEYILKIID